MIDDWNGKADAHVTTLVLPGDSKSNTRIDEEIETDM